MAYTPSLAPELYTNAAGKVDDFYRHQMREQDLTPEATDRRKPRMTLVVGPSPFTMPRGWEFFLASPYEGASYISTVLHNAGYPVKIVDVRYSKDPYGEAFRKIMDGTDVLGICTYEDNFPFNQKLMRMVREARPDIPILCGGSLVTSVPRIFLERTDCDVAVISEGEITILELMDAYCRGEWATKLKDIRGIWYREPDGSPLGKIVANPPRGQMMDLDCLPRMRLDLWPQATEHPLGLQPQIIASYSRGCKMDCSFCYRTTPQERAKSPQKMEEELSWLKSRYGIEFVFFVDLTFTSHKKQTMDIMEVIKQHDIGWTCLTRCADVDAERARAMKESGCDIALYGVESLGAAALKEARKGNTENITIKAMRTTWDAGFRFGGLTIVGLPGETEESLNHMCEWAEESRHITRVKYLSAMPGTTVYNQGIEQGMLKSEVDHLNWLSIEQALVQDEFLNYNGLPENVVRTAYKRIYDSYQPGPVMDFKHYPLNFQYFHPNTDDGSNASIEYAGKGWRSEWSSAAAPLVEGWEDYTLDKTGTPKTMDTGAKNRGLYGYGEVSASSAGMAAHAK
jgi:anaerobic magnesium-protoporphyrin IX monomethyl ester cyclase